MDKYLNEDAITAEIMSYVKNRIYNYAVLIDGDWGTGKTYFIQKSIIPTLEGSGYMPIYISLYGVNSTDTVSQKIALSILTNKLPSDKRTVAKQCLPAIGSFVLPIGQTLLNATGISFGENPYYKHQGWLSGRVTTDDNFTFYEKPALDENAPVVPEGDFVANGNAGMYYVSVDPAGKLGWKSGKLTYVDTHAHVIEVLTGKASNSYKAFLRKLGISYIVAGVETLDYEMAMEKLKKLFGIETLMLGGGGVLNWSFIQAGMCDEVSVVIAPVADGSSKTPALFNAKDEWASDTPVAFELQSAEIKDGGSVWRRYLVKR